MDYIIIMIKLLCVHTYQSSVFVVVGLIPLLLQELVPTRQHRLKWSMAAHRPAWSAWAQTYQMTRKLLSSLLLCTSETEQAKKLTFPRGRGLRGGASASVTTARLGGRGHRDAFISLLQDNFCFLPFAWGCKKVPLPWRLGTNQQPVIAGFHSKICNLLCIQYSGSDQREGGIEESIPRWTRREGISPSLQPTTWSSKGSGIRADLICIEWR